MADESNSKNEEHEGLEAAEDEIDEEPGSGMGSAADMDRAEDAEDEENDEE